MTDADKVFHCLNEMTNAGPQKELEKLFLLNAYIRIDGFFLSPFSLISIRRGLRRELWKWEISPQGWRFLFKDGASVCFIGKSVVTVKEGKITSVIVDTEKIERTSQHHHQILLRYIRCLDTFYFMTTQTDISLQLMSNPLAHMKEWLTIPREHFRGRGRGSR